MSNSKKSYWLPKINAYTEPIESLKCLIRDIESIINIRNSEKRARQSAREAKKKDEQHNPDSVTPLHDVVIPGKAVYQSGGHHDQR